MVRTQARTNMPPIWRRRNRRGNFHTHIDSETLDMVHLLHHQSEAAGIRLPVGDFTDACLRLGLLIARWQETHQHTELRETISGLFWECYGDPSRDCLDEEEEGGLHEGNG